MPPAARKLLVPAAWIGTVAAALLVIFPLGFPNYDTIYALVWGRELAHGVSPDYGAALPPTPHPLSDLLCMVTTPLGEALKVRLPICSDEPPTRCRWPSNWSRRTSGWTARCIRSA